MPSLGPTGYNLARLLKSLGVHCEVIAPSMIPKASGDNVKTMVANGGVALVLRHPEISIANDKTVVQRDRRFSTLAIARRLRTRTDARPFLSGFTGNPNFTDRPLSLHKGQAGLG